MSTRPGAGTNISRGVKAKLSWKLRAKTQEFVQEIWEILEEFPARVLEWWWARRARGRLTLCRPRQRPARWLGWRPGPSRRPPNWTSWPPVTHTHTQIHLLSGHSRQCRVWTADQIKRRALEKKKHLIKRSHYHPLKCHIIKNMHDKGSPKQTVTLWK